MSATNRAQRLVKLVATLKKRYKVVLPAERPLFESLLYACLVENSSHEAAAKSIEHLESNYFDWNEVRVSTRGELAEALKPLNDPAESADRLKRALQSVFESIYAFDLEPLKKQNLGLSVKQIGGYDGVTPFAVAYVTQNGLGGHAIATNEGLLIALQAFDIISEAERGKHVVPGLERAIPKNKGAEAFSLLHQLGVEVGKSPYGPGAKKVLLEIDPACKDRLPKKPAPPIEQKPVAPPAPLVALAPAKGPAKSPAKGAAKAEPAKPTAKDAAGKDKQPPASIPMKANAKPAKGDAPAAAQKKPDTGKPDAAKPPAEKASSAAKAPPAKPTPPKPSDKKSPEKGGDKKGAATETKPATKKPADSAKKPDPKAPAKKPPTTGKNAPAKPASIKPAPAKKPDAPPAKRKPR
ncbi:MAG: hypothetical protein ACRCT8_04895 [Lacipirellulaceae bacterium]